MNTKITVKDIIDITKGKLICGDENEICENFSRNTKEINQDDIFVGFKGDKFDGGKFYEDALKAGAKGCIINKIEGLEIKRMPGKFIIQVEDTVKAIGQIAKFKREKYHIPVIAITGSVGKTSTKDIIYSVVSQKYHTLKTQGNLNNHIGMPFTLLRLKDHEALVVEMGMNHFGELSYLTNIAQPTVAVITNVGTAHIGNLGSRENILKAKLEILEGLQKDGTVIINNDNDLLHKWQSENDHYKVITYGIENPSNYMATDIEYTEAGSKYKVNHNEEIEVPVKGEAFVELSAMRLDIQKSEYGYTVINDCYNANYDSMKAALDCLSKMQGGRKIAVLGDMGELGEYAAELHQKVGKVAAEDNVDILITVGTEAKQIAEAAKANGLEKIYSFDELKDAIDKIKKILAVNDIVLVKASHYMNFEEIVKAL